MNSLKNQSHIAGQWQEGQSQGMLCILDKYHQTPLAEIRLASPAQMEQALAASITGFEHIRTWSAGKRAAHLEKLHQQLGHHQNDFVELIIAEAGKPRTYAQTEVARGLATLEAAIRQTYAGAGEVVGMDFGAGEGQTAFTRRFPIGPVACITPFNFPLNLALHKIAPALAVGNSFILKPPPQAPLTALALMALIEEAGYPAGVGQVVVCDVATAQMMVQDPRPRMLSFTGSASVGWQLKNQAGKKKIALELGGNAAVVIDETADWEAALPALAQSVYLYAGQICISTQRVIVVKAIYEAFKSRFLEEIAKIVTGNPYESACVNGPLIDAANLRRVQTWVEEARASGAVALCGGQVADEAHHLYAPTLLEHAPPDSKVVAEEVFAPLGVLQKAEDFRQALQMANESRYGLQAGVYTRDLYRMQEAFETLEVGGIIINRPPGFRMDVMPYGGVKDSGLGREGLRYAMEEMSEARLLVF